MRLRNESRTEGCEIRSRTVAGTVVGDGVPLRGLKREVTRSEMGFKSTDFKVEISPY